MNPLENASQYLKIEDAARLLGVSRRWVYRRIWSGDLPASKVGGLYFIQRTDLQNLLEQRRGGQPLLDTGPLAEVEKCGYCSRLLSSDRLVGEVCLTPGCDKLICTECLAEGIRHCAQHTPAKAEKLDEVQRRYERGESPAFIKASAARLLEINFLNRLQSRLGRISNLIHPLSSELLTTHDWNAWLEQGDERGQVMRLQNKVMLDSNTLASIPLNAFVAYAVPPQKRQKGPALQVYIQVISRLERMTRDGFDDQPLSAEELTAWLSRFSDEAQRDQVFRLIVLASPTGWERAARAAIQGDAPGSAFMHRMLLVYLYDLSSGELIYNLRDERARPYAELFTPLLPSEQLEEAVQAVQNELVLHQSLAFNFATQIYPYPPDLIRQAFEQLAATGRFSLIEMPEYGQVIVRK